MFTTADEWIRFFEYEDVYAFCAKISENPEDLAPQLVFADWLEERYPDPKFVEAYRKHVHRADGDRSIDVPIPDEIKYEIATHISFSEGRFGVYFWDDQTFTTKAERLTATGMVETLWVEASFLDKITQFCPLIRRLGVCEPIKQSDIDKGMFENLTWLYWMNTFSVSEARTVAESPSIRKLRGLTLAPCDPPYAYHDDSGFELLLNSPYLSNLEQICLVGSYLHSPSNVVGIIANSPNLANLKQLTVGRNFTFSATDALVIVNSPYLNRLEHLIADWDDMTEEGMTELANSPKLKQIKTFEIFGFPPEYRQHFQILLDSPHLSEEARQSVLKSLAELT